MGLPFRTRCIHVAFIAALAGLNGCQSAPDVLESAKPPPADAAAVAPGTPQTYSSGQTKIDLFIDGSIASSANDYRDGAILALNELGAGQMTLAVHDLRASGSASGQVAQLASKETKLLIGPLSLAKAFEAVPGAPAIILLGSQPASTAVAIASDEIDGAVEVASYAAGAGRAKIMVVSTRALSSPERQRLQAGLKRGCAQLLDIITDPVSSEGTKKLAKLGEAQAVLLIGADAPSVAAPALRQRGAVSTETPFLGTQSWPAESFREQALNGSLLALIDQKSLQRISKRFQAAFGRPLSLDAAYGFDAVAVAAGIVRAKGGAGLTTSAMHANAGFAGATGVFRFGSTNYAERRLAIYRLEQGKLVLQDGAASGF